MSYHDIDDARGDEHIDTRDLIELRDTLIAERVDLWEALEAQGGRGVDLAERIDELDAGIAAITELEDAGIEDFPYGAQMIREDCFEDHARELAEDIGSISPTTEWPLSYIDWPAAAQALKADYTTVDFLGHTYYVR